MTMMREHFGYEDDWIIDSECSNHLADDQSDVMEVGWFSEKEVLQDLDNIEKNSSTKDGRANRTYLLKC